MQYFPPPPNSVHFSDHFPGGFLCESKLILHFCKSLITKHSHEDTRIQLKNSVLKQAKMVSIYQRKNITWEHTNKNLN